MADNYITQNYLFNTLNTICAKIDSTFSKSNKTISSISVGLARPTGSPYTNLRNCLIMTYDDGSVFNLRVNDLLTEIPMAEFNKLGGVLGEPLTTDDVNYTIPVKMNDDGKLFVPEIKLATSTEIGLVKPDNESITVDANGTLRLVNPSGATDPSGQVLTNVSELVNDVGYITNNAIPKNVSTFTNDAGYITSKAIPTDVSAFNNDMNYVKTDNIPLASTKYVGGLYADKVSEIEKSDYRILIKMTTNGYLTGATPIATDEYLGGVLVETIGVDEEESFTIPIKRDVNGNIFTPKELSNYENDVNFATIDDVPTKVSELENDSNYATVNQIPTDISAFNNDSNYAIVDEIPTKVSQLANDKGYINELPIATSTALGMVRYDGSTIMADPDGTIHAIDQRTIDPSGAVVVYISSLVNDKGYITSNAIPKNVSAFTNDAKYITQANVPTNISSFNNDFGYITLDDVPKKISYFANDKGYALAKNVPVFDNETIVKDEDGNWKISDSFHSEELYDDNEVDIAINTILGFPNSDQT